MHPHIDPLDQQLHDPRLLGREQLIPQRVELQQPLQRLFPSVVSCSARAGQVVNP